MRTFLKIFGALVVAFILTGLIIPNHIDVRRSIEINAPVHIIHYQINDLNNWPRWSPWLEMDPSVKTSLGDIHSGVGAHQSWSGQSGAGQLTFTNVSEQTGVEYEMSFEGDSTKYLAGLSYSTDGNKTTVTWYMTGDMQPIIIGNYFALLMDALVGDSFVIGLEKLKEVVEKES